MTFEELDVALEELETRLERLRALYEQYFLGFEKIEPQVARKDVDRRIYVLRREKIRNTGKRFKLQTIIQRYNTFQQYWQRICREIENGTYKRHLARAERIMGASDLLTIAARRRFGKASVDKLAAAAAESAAADDTSPLDEIEADDIGDAHPFPPVPPTDPAPLPAIPRSPTPSHLPVPPVSLPPNAPQRSARPSRYESLTLDMDLGSWDPERAIRARHQGSAPKAAPAPLAPAPDPEPPIEAKPRVAPEPAHPKSLPKAAPPPPPRPTSRVPPPKPASRVPPPKPASLPRAAPPARVAAPARQEKPAAPPPNAGGLSDERIKELHEKLVRTKRENKEAGQVSVESLAKTLRATEEKLRAEHKNRKIEFEIVLRDGKTVVKPKVR